jgi:hypothetical protein
MKTHELKTWPSFFEAVANGTKTFECRKNDRDFATGDTLILKEYDPAKDVVIDDWKLTGRTLTRTVGFVVHGGVFGIAPGHCVMALLPAPNPQGQTPESEARRLSEATGSAQKISR